MSTPPPRPPSSCVWRAGSAAMTSPPLHRRVSPQQWTLRSRRGSGMTVSSHLPGQTRRRKSLGGTASHVVFKSEYLLRNHTSGELRGALACLQVPADFPGVEGLAAGRDRDRLYLQSSRGKVKLPANFSHRGAFCSSDVHLREDIDFCCCRILKKKKKSEVSFTFLLFHITVGLLI